MPRYSDHQPETRFGINAGTTLIRNQFVNSVSNNHKYSLRVVESQLWSPSTEMVLNLHSLRCIFESERMTSGSSGNCAFNIPKWSLPMMLDQIKSQVVCLTITKRIPDVVETVRGVQHWSPFSRHLIRSGQFELKEHGIWFLIYTIPTNPSKFICSPKSLSIVGSTTGDLLNKIPLLNYQKPRSNFGILFLLIRVGKGDINRQFPLSSSGEILKRIHRTLLTQFTEENERPAKIISV